MAQRSFVAAMKGYFGFKEGQSLNDFQQELKALTHEDKLYFARELRKVGEDCADPTAPAAA